MPQSLPPTPLQNRLADPAQRPLVFYFRILRQQAGKIVSITVLLTALVVLVCASMPPSHLGSATIAIDRQATPEGIGADRVLSTGDDQFMATQQDLLRADVILRPVAERYNLFEREHQLQRHWFWRYPASRERAIRNAPIVLKRLKIERLPNTYLLVITYRDRDPQIAADVANAIADSYLREIFETRVREAGRLTSSMEQQLIDLKQKMESTHARLMAYQRDLGSADPEQKTSVLVARLQALNTENTIAQADRIAKEAVYREARDGSLPAIEVSSQSTDLLHDAENLKAAQANLAIVAATYGDQHPEYLKAQAETEAARTALEESRHTVATRIVVEYRQTLVRERMLSAAVAETKQQVDDLTAQSFDYLQLKHEADAAERVYEDLFAKIKQLGINSELQNNVIRLADSARPAARAVFPNWRTIVTLSLAFFSLACCVWVISAELIDGSVKEADAVQAALGVPVVCALPRVADLELHLALGSEGVRQTEPRWHSLQNGFFDEGVRHLRGFLMLSMQTNGPRSVLITSAVPGEGKTSLVVALGMVSAEQGKRTLLIDADLRQPSIEKLVRMDPDAGLAGVLAEKIDWRDATRPVVSCPNLFVLGSGVPFPLALVLLGPRMRILLAQATREFDLIVVDSPPLLGCAETLELAAATEVTVLAARSKHTSMKALEKTVQTLRRVNVSIAGIVLNESTLATDAIYKAYARYFRLASA